jgi:lipopolysaccharide transport system permease protein
MTATVDILSTPVARRHAESYVVEPRSTGMLSRLSEVWHYRRLLLFFGAMNMRRLYANTWLGWLWVPLRPGLSVGAQTLVLGGLLKAPSNGIPYFLFFATGIGAWQMLNHTWYIGTRSLEINRRYIKRVHFPRLIPLISSASMGLIWTTLYVGVAVAGLGYYWAADGHMYLEFGLGLLEAAAGLTLIAGIALTLSLWTSIYGAQARDPRLIVRHLLRFWLYATPVIYPLAALPPRWATAAQFNPMTAPMEMIRDGLYGAGTVELQGVLVAVGMILVVGWGGLWFFGRSETKALDYL